MQNDLEDTALTSLLRKATQNAPKGLLADDISHLITCFVPTNASVTRSKAYLVLSAICERLRSTNPQSGEVDPATTEILHIFLDGIESRLADVEECTLLEAISFVAALFGVDPRSASSIFQRDGFQESMMDSLDLLPSSTWLPRVVASVLGHACGHKSCRAVLSPRCSSWLASAVNQASDSNVRGTVALAQVKFAQGMDADVSSTASTNIVSPFKRQDELMEIMRKIVLDSSGRLTPAADAIEGLAYLSSIPSIKERIVKDSALLHVLLSFRPFSTTASSQPDESTPATVLYGLSVIISNLCVYRLRLTDEETHIEKLKRMTQAGADNAGEKDEGKVNQFDEDGPVRERAKLLVKAGAVDTIVAIVKATESRTTRVVAGNALLSLVEDKENRGKVLQAGGGKALAMIIRASLKTAFSGTSKSLGKTSLDRSDLLPIQALAKLAITASPLQVFGPNEGAAYDAIIPFTILLLHESSTLLQLFEALMALTNLSSASPESSSRIAKAEGLVNKAEFLLLDENVMVRRAATELICNLVAGSEEIYCRFSGEQDPQLSDRVGSAKSRLQILVALSDVEDDGTRLAASGALGTLTSSPAACQSLLSLELERHRVLPVLKQLIDPSAEDEDQGQTNAHDVNPGLVHRGVVCVRNFLANQANDASRRKLAEAVEKAHLVSSLVGVVKSAAGGNTSEAVIRPAVEALKWLMDSGVKVIEYA